MKKLVRTRTLPASYIASAKVLLTRATAFLSVSVLAACTVVHAPAPTPGPQTSPSFQSPSASSISSGSGYSSPVAAGLPRQCRFVYERMLSNDFEALLYTASYSDLVSALGRDANRARDHYVRNGCREGRTITFEPLDYVAGYDDLVRNIGLSEQRALDHYFFNGFRERRQPNRFCGAKYAAIYPDVRAKLGNNEVALARHYIQFGFREGRGNRGQEFQVAC
ncbi:MAG: hypothetical protein AAF141_06430 [Pseudomonadota bacterium]